MLKFDHPAASTLGKITPLLAACLNFSGLAQHYPGLEGMREFVSIDAINNTSHMSSISHLRMGSDTF